MNKKMMLPVMLISSFLALSGCEKAKETADGAVKNTKEVVNDVAGVVKENVANTAGEAKEGASAVVENGKELAGEIADVASEKAGVVVDSIKNGAETAIERTKAVTGDVVDAASEKASEAVDGIKNGAGAVLKESKDIVDTVGEKTNGVVDSIKEKSSTAVTNAKAVGAGLLGKAADTVDDAGKDVNEVMSEKEALALAKKSNCLVCHAIDKKRVGPAWNDVAARYKGDPTAKNLLIGTVSKGGKGNWTEVTGGISMPSYSPRVSDENIEKLVVFILSL